MRKLDVRTVRIDLWRPFGPLLGYLASSAAGIVSPTAVGMFHSDFARNPVGTGPYRLRAIETGKTVTLVANEHFWGQPPQLSAIVFRQIGDNAGQLARLQEGQAQVLAGASQEQLAALAQDRRFTVLRTAGANVSWVLMNPERAPQLADIRVRRAILQAVDVNRIVAAAWGSAGQRAINPFPESMPCWNRVVLPYTYDPPRARALLAEAGYPAGFALTLDYSETPRPYMPQPKAVAEAVAADLAAVGVNVTLHAHPWDELTALSDRRQLAFQLLGWYAMPEPDQFILKMLVESPYSRGDFGDELPALAEKAARSYSPSERCGYYQQIQQIFHDAADRILLAHAEYIDAVARDIQGYVLDADGVQNLRGVSLTH